MSTHHRVIFRATHRYSMSESDQQESTGHSGGLRKKKPSRSANKPMAGLRYFTYHPMSAGVDAGLSARATGLSELFFRFFRSSVLLIFVIFIMSRCHGQSAAE